jgi:hypothetical protein
MAKTQSLAGATDGLPKNGTELVCEPFGECQPCPEDDVRPPPSASKTANLIYCMRLIDAGAVLSALRQPTSSPLRSTTACSWHTFDTARR